MFALDYRRLPRLSSWRDCDVFFKDKLKELTARRRNGVWDDETLPLAKWRDKHLRIQRYQPIGEPGYALVYHDTIVVLYYDDGRIAFNASWDSPSTRSFFSMLAPMGWDIDSVRLPGTAFNRQTRGSLARGYVNTRRGEWHTTERTDMLIIGAHGFVKNPRPFEYEKRLANLPERKRIKERLKGFEQWYRALSSCGNSLLAVALEHEHTKALVYSGGYNRYAHFEQAADRFWKNTDDEISRREVVTWSLVCQAGERLFLGLDSARVYDMRYADDVLKRIYRHLFDANGGWRMEKVVVPAGEKP